MRNLALLVLVHLTLAVSGCGNAVDTGANTAAIDLEAAANPVIVTMGGFGSCRSDGGVTSPRGHERWIRSETISRRFAVGGALWVRSCFDKLGRLHFISSSAPNNIQTATTSDPSPFFRAISAVAQGTGRPVYMIGHSYGGWLGMYATWHLPATVDVRMLFTVDPISPLSCGPTNYVKAVVSPINAGSHLAGCQKAPTEFAAPARRSIRARLAARGWRHYYQRNFLPLRSSAYDFDGEQPGASYDVSSFLSNFPGGINPSLNAHTGIDELSLIWHSFEASIEQNLGQG